MDMTRRSAALGVLLNTPPAGDGAITQNERQSIVGCYAGILTGAAPIIRRRTANMMLLLNTLPPGDGATSQADRQGVAGCYGGVLAGPAASRPGFIPEDFYEESVL